MKRTILILLSFIVLGFTVVGCKTSSSDRQSKKTVVDNRTAVVEPTFDIDRIKAKISASNPQLVWSSPTMLTGERCWVTEFHHSINGVIKLTPSEVILVGGSEGGAAYTLIGMYTLNDGVFKSSRTSYINESTLLPLLGDSRRFDPNTYKRQRLGYTFELTGFPDDELLRYSIYKAKS